MELDPTRNDAEDRLSGLPPELILHICDVLSDSQPALARLARCSQRLWTIASPILCSRIDLLAERPPPECDDQDVLRHWESLTALFLREPQLGTNVRHLAIRTLAPIISRRASSRLAPGIKAAANSIPGFDITSSWLWSSPEVAQSNDKGDIEMADDSEGDSDWSTVDGSSSDEDYQPDDLPEAPPSSTWSKIDMDRWVSYAPFWVRESIIFGLLPLCIPKVETLDLSLPPKGLRHLDHVLQHGNQRRAPFETSSPLADLTSLVYGCANRSRRGDLWYGAFVLPHAKAIFLHYVMGRETDSSFAADPRSLELTHLELRDCRLWPQQLQRILILPMALKTFIYIVGEPRSGPEYMNPISYRSIRKALLAQKDSLEQIWIDYPHDYEFDPDSDQSTLPIGSFAGFTALRRLRIATTYLFGFIPEEDMDPGRLKASLPEQIEELYLTHADEDEETIEGVGLLLALKKSGRFPQLRVLHMEISITWILMNVRELRNILNYAKEVAVEMEIYNNHSESRIESRMRWFAAARDGFPGNEKRKEDRWGFDGEIEWPERVSGCMKRPVYERISIDDDGWIRDGRQALLLVGD